MINIKPLKAEDMIWVVEHGVKEVGLRMDSNGALEKVAKEREESGLCKTGFVNGEIVGCAGADLLWEGTAEVWATLTYSVDASPIATFMCIREGLKEIMSDNNLTRVQAYARVNLPNANRLLTNLGFEREGLMRKFTPDNVDCYMYSIVR